MQVSERQRLDVYIEQLQDTATLNAAILDQYRAACDGDAVRRSHWFGGRYENIYLEPAQVPALVPLLAAAVAGARRFLGPAAPALEARFWFNDMAPGQRTLPHDHDVADELVSGVYYVRVPEDSGELVLERGPARTVVTPAAGRLVYFRPDVSHEVTQNRSAERRLSIGMNFVPLEDDAI